MSSSLTENPLQPSEPSPIPGFQKRKRLCLTICTIRKPGYSEAEFGEYLFKIHAQLSKGLLAKYGMIRWSMCHNTDETRKFLPLIYGPQFNSGVNYDCFSQAVFEDLDRVISMTEDPFYKQYIKTDAENFADSENTKISIGWLEDHIMDGKLVD